MRKPAVLLCTVPVLYALGDNDDRTGYKAYCGLAVFLIPALACGTDKELTSAFFSVVDMPVIAASRLKCYICEE